MKKLLPLVALLFLLSCNNDNEKAQERIETAKAFMSNADYNQARLQLDSIKFLQPNALSVLQESQALSWQIEEKESQRSLIYLDSMLVVNGQKADSLKETLLFEKNADYQTIGIYMDKNQTLEKTMGKSCLRFYVNENGLMTVVGVILAQGKGGFSGIKAQTSSGIYGETPDLTKDDSNNFNGEVAQTLNFTRGNDNGFIEFLYTYKEEPLKISFTGAAKDFSYTFSPTEKEALEKVYDLTIALSEVNRLNKEKQLTAKKLEFAKKAQNSEKVKDKN